MGTTKTVFLRTISMCEIQLYYQKYVNHRTSGAKGNRQKYEAKERRLQKKENIYENKQKEINNKDKNKKKIIKSTKRKRKEKKREKEMIFPKNRNQYILLAVTI